MVKLLGAQRTISAAEDTPALPGGCPIVCNDRVGKVHDAIEGVNATARAGAAVRGKVRDHDDLLHAYGRAIDLDA